MKAKALAHNLDVLRSKGGPKNFMRSLSELRGQNAEELRMKCVMDRLKYVKNKGARDLLMELGLVRNAVALDIRVRNILNKVGVQIPEGLEDNTKLYDLVQDDILGKICKPLGILGVEFDRMLYQNYETIMKTT